MIAKLEKWFINKAISELGYMPEKNEKAKHVFWKLLFIIPSSITICSYLDKDESPICFVASYSLVQIFFLFLIYFWLKYGVGYYYCWVSKKDAPIYYWFNFIFLACVYLFIVAFPYWLLLTSWMSSLKSYNMSFNKTCYYLAESAF